MKRSSKNTHIAQSQLRLRWSNHRLLAATAACSVTACTPMASDIDSVNQDGADCSDYYLELFETASEVETTPLALTGCEPGLRGLECLIRPPDPDESDAQMIFGDLFAGIDTFSTSTQGTPWQLRAASWEVEMPGARAPIHFTMSGEATLEDVAIDFEAETPTIDFSLFLRPDPCETVTSGVVIETAESPVMVRVGVGVDTYEIDFIPQTTGIIQARIEEQGVGQSLELTVSTGAAEVSGSSNPLQDFSLSDFRQAHLSGGGVFSIDQLNPAEPPENSLWMLRLAQRANQGPPEPEGRPLPTDLYCIELGPNQLGGDCPDGPVKARLDNRSYDHVAIFPQLDSVIVWGLPGIGWSTLSMSETSGVYRGSKDIEDDQSDTPWVWTYEDRIISAMPPTLACYQDYDIFNAPRRAVSSVSECLFGSTGAQ